MAYKDPHDPRYKESRRKHYYANKALYVARNNAKKLLLRNYIVEAKNKPCMDCGGEFHFSAMDFDHREDELKIRNLSLLHAYSLRVVQEEIAKCDVVCANCHRVRTYMRMSRSGSSVSKTVGSGSIT